MAELAARLAAGEEAAYAEFYDACGAKLYAYLRRRVGSHEAASEALQETFLRLVRHQRRLRRVENLEAYAFRIASNEANRWLGRRKTTELLNDHLVHGVDEHNARDAQEASETTEQIDLALAQLDDISRNIVQLKTYGDLTFEKIATAVSLPLGTVATRYRRALVRLRQIMERGNGHE